MRRLFVSLYFGAAVACSRAPATSSPPATSQAMAIHTDSATVAKIIDEGQHRSHIREDLAYLTDVIGPRLTGSPAMRRANDWVAAKLREYGADSVSLEGYPFGVSWQRGPLTMRQLLPNQRWLEATSWAWAPGTSGPKAGKVLYVDARDRADYERRFAPNVHGAWVMLSPPAPLHSPDAPSARDSARVDSLRRAQREAQRAIDPAFANERGALLLRDSVAGLIIDSGKGFGLFTMSGSPDDISPIPQVVVGNETYASFHRLLLAGEQVRVEVDAANTFGRDTLTQYNTIGEIRGSEKPDEVVIIGAHLDSWDIATGATDNATGSMAVLEAARLLGTLKAAGIRPRRTIRFAFFSGEEQGMYGSQYYVLRHRTEIPTTQAVLVLDNGTGKIRGIALSRWEDLGATWRTMVAPLQSLGTIVVHSGTKTGTDHMPFLEVGVPAFNYEQYWRGYDWTWHTQVDVLDHTVPEDVEQAAIVMATNALQLANLDALIPRRRPSR